VLTEKQKEYIEFIAKSVIKSEGIPQETKYKCLTMYRAGDSIALDYIENQTAYYKQDTLAQYLKKNLSNDEESSGYLISMHLCNSLLIQGYSDSKVYITLATDNNFRILTTKDFSGIQPYVIRSFADGKYILIGGDSGQIIVLRREENSNNITNLKTFTFKDSENNLEGSIKDII